MQETTPGGEPTTRERILAAALPLFAEHGFAGTSVRTIGAAAGVNVATLAYHFSGKEGLYAACVERLYEDLAGLRVEGLLDGDPITGLVRATWGFAREHRVHVRLLHRHLLDRGRHHDAATERWLGPLMGRLSPVLTPLRPEWASWGEARRRLLVFSAVHLVVRFVLDDPEQLAGSLGVAPERVDESVVEWLAHLVRVALIAPEA